ncbi:MAG: hypothetical protein H7287_08005 [Thermoleophilia bacterium]|nr:hypothetical protein [Thermoleophilia bacterium]
MSIAPARTRDDQPQLRGAWRMLPTPRVAGLLIAFVVAALAASGTGFGASSGTVAPSANVIGTLSLSDPTTLEPNTPLCTRQLAPLDTDGCTDTTFASGPPTLGLGSLTGADVQAGRLTWKVSTTNPLGYVVHVRNAGTAPLLHAGTGGIPDMQSSPMVPASAVPNSTHAGIAVGDPIADNQASVNYPGSPWVTSAGAQGELFRGVPTTSIVVAQRTTAQVGDPVSISLAAAQVPSALAPSGSLTASLSIIASAL